MNKKWATILMIIILLAFIGYIIFDVALKKEKSPGNSSVIEIDSSGIADQWIVSKVFEPGLGKLKAVAASEKGLIILGGESFVSGYTSDLKALWTLKTEKPVTAISATGDTIFASTIETILVINGKGELISEWGPFEDSTIITSIALNKTFLAFADAGNKSITILDKKGNFRKMIGKSGEPFIIPSLYFDVALTSDNTLYAANTGKSRVETRDINGLMTGFFGEPGIAPGAFCGCCNPSHFALIPGGFITAEKGINRIKILNEKGEFVEFVSAVNNFSPPNPLDVASVDGKIIYAANPADSKVYVFRRK
jgi:hypothetical protein